ncbi:MAG: potassium-transporting ATPase subunit KdpA [Gemmataceae bacterium]|nr:potassium-transporting ATPase subunit KdpA [Gemmataceae bacterium]
MLQVWLLPLLIVGAMIALSIPIGLYMARIMDGRYRPLPVLGWLERRFDTGPQSWKQYCLALLFFNTAAFVAGYLILVLQPLALNPEPDSKGMLAPTTVFHTVCSFLTNTNQQHYSGEQHLSYLSQLFFICWFQFITPAVGLAALVAIIRGLRGDNHMGNFYLDTWRGTIYVFLPFCLIVGVALIANGVPMTLVGAAQARIVEPGADGQSVMQILARGPVAAIVAIKQIGTNGGGFFGANAAHPFENPTAFTNFLLCWCIIILPASAVVMFGKMLSQMRHARVIYGVMLAILALMISWGVYWDSLQPNPALTAHPALTDRQGQPHKISVEGPNGTLIEKEVPVPAVAGLPVDQELGNLEGKELRYGTSAGPTWAACTTATSNGSVNCMHDSLNPLAGLTPFTGMWLNISFGGVGVGLINLLIYLIVGVFLAGLMVGRTPEYLGKKVEAREMKLAMLALLAHPILILGPTGLFAALGWNEGSTNPTGPHAFGKILYEFSSASANNGSGFEGLADTYGLNANPNPAPQSPHWDIACGIVLLLARFIPILAPIALAGSLAAKKPTPFTVGTMRTDTLTFAFVLLGTILLVGALLFLPAAMLGPVAEHLGPIPFGG